MAAPAAVALVHQTLDEIAQIYPRGLLEWVRNKRLDLQVLLDEAEDNVERAAQAWRPKQHNSTKKLQEALDELRWAYAEAIAAYQVRSIAKNPSLARQQSAFETLAKTSVGF